MNTFLMIRFLYHKWRHIHRIVRVIKAEITEIRSLFTRICNIDESDGYMDTDDTTHTYIHKKFIFDQNVKRKIQSITI